MQWMSFFILFVTAATCSLIGSFLVLRKLSMVSDAISHCVLLGIILAYFITKDVTSPWLVIGAALFGIITVFTIESLSSTGLVKNDDAVGIVFPLFFALAVILITKFARNVHLDTDIVLMGEIILAPLNTTNFLGFEIPKALLHSSFILILNLLFIIIFFKELKVSTFDKDFSTIAGFSGAILFYALMGLSSLSAVISFDSVGAILVISFLITPPTTAYLITKDLKKMLVVAVIFSFINSLLGFLFSSLLNVSMSGMTATVAGLMFLLVLLFNKEGLITTIFKRYENKKMIKIHILLLHIGNHINSSREEEELGIDTIHIHLNWKFDEMQKRIKYLIGKNLLKINREKSIYELTSDGVKKYNELAKEYGI